MDRNQRSRSRIATVLVVGLFAVLTFGGVAATPTGAASWHVSFRSTGKGAEETPVFAKIGADVPPGDYLLTPEKTGKPLTAHVFQFGDSRFLGTVLKAVPADGANVFVMTADTKSEESRQGVEFRQVDRNVEVLVAGKPLTVYRTDEPTKPYFHNFVSLVAPV